MNSKNTSLGFDLSTQSLTVVAIAGDSGKIVHRNQIDYRSDSRLRAFEIDPNTAIIPRQAPGEANQPPLLFLTALDVLLRDMQDDGFDFRTVQAVNFSAQQHGHVYLGEDALGGYTALQRPERERTPLAALFADAFSYPYAPIWMTTNSKEQADLLCREIGGEAEMIARSGSASPARFSGAIILRVAQHNNAQYSKTVRIHLLSSWLASLFCGDIDTGVDYGNASGTSLQNFRQRAWDYDLLQIMERHGADELKAKLPTICSPLHIVGEVAPYFCARYGFNADCRVLAGSGDNPQSKVLTKRDLLSLGSSFVIMANDASSGDSSTNAMYDGLGRPFLFGCRTNGTLIWDQLRTAGTLSLEMGEQALQQTFFADMPYIWQAQTESFPLSPICETQEAPAPCADIASAGNVRDVAAARYCRVVESSLALTAYYSQRYIATETDEALMVTGGASSSPEIMRRCAALWRRPVAAISDSGAALGAAVAAHAMVSADNEAEARAVSDRLCAQFVLSDSVVTPGDEECRRAEQYTARLTEHASALGFPGLS